VRTPSCPPASLPAQSVTSPQNSTASVSHSSRSWLFLLRLVITPGRPTPLPPPLCHLGGNTTLLLDFPAGTSKPILALIPSRNSGSNSSTGGVYARQGKPPKMQVASTALPTRHLTNS